MTNSLDGRTTFNRRFYKVMLGRGSSAAAEARADGFIGATTTLIWT